MTPLKKGLGKGNPPARGKGNPPGIYTKAAREARRHIEKEARRQFREQYALANDAQHAAQRDEGGGRGASSDARPENSDDEQQIAAALNAYEREMLEWHLRHPRMILSHAERDAIAYPMVEEQPAEEDHQMSSNSSATQAAEDPCAGYPVQGGGGTVRYLHARELLVQDHGLTVQGQGFVHQTYGLGLHSD